MFLSKMLIRSYMIVHNIVEENIFVAILYKLLVHHIKACFKITGKQRIIMPKKANMLKSKIMKEK